MRIGEIGDGKVTIRFNARGENLAYEIRYSANPITEDNFNDATLVESVVVTGSGEVKSAVLDLTVGKESKFYIAVQATAENVKSEIKSVRAGGVELVYIDPNRITSVYCGEVIKDLSPLIDEYDLIMDGGLPSNRLSQFYYKKGDWLPGMLDPYTETHERYGTDLAPIIDLEYNHYIEYITVFYSHETYDLDVRSSKDFANFATPSAWDATNESYPASHFRANNWTVIPINA